MSIIAIQKNQDGEYRVPSKEFTELGAYYTDDKKDAISTFKTIHGENTSYTIKRVTEFKEEELFVLSRKWPNPQPHGQTFYVANLPGEGNAHSDWGYTTDYKKALPVSKINKEKFVKYMDALGEKASFVKLEKKETEIDNLLKRKKVVGIQL